MIKFVEPTSKDEVIGFLVFIDKDYNIYKVIAADEPIIDTYAAYKAFEIAYDDFHGVSTAKDFCKNLNIEFPSNGNDKEIRIESFVFTNEYICQLYRYFFVRILAYDKDKKFVNIIPEYVIDNIKSNINKDIEENEKDGNETIVMSCKACLGFIDAYFRKENK